MPNPIHENNIDVALAGGFLVSVGATLATILYHDGPISVRKSMGALIGTSVVQSVWGIAAREVWHLNIAWSLAGSGLIGAIGGITILKAAARYGERYGRSKAEEFLGETVTKTVASATVTETTEVKKP